jgi:hypothetical protein
VERLSAREREHQVLLTRLADKDAVISDSQADFNAKELAYASALRAKDEQLLAKEGEHIAALKAKDEIFALKVGSLSSTLETTKQAVRELVASKDRAALDAQAQYASALEAQASALESEFQSRLELRMEEFRVLEEEYNLDLARLGDDLLAVRGECERARRDHALEEARAVRMEDEEGDDGRGAPLRSNHERRIAELEASISKLRVRAMPGVFCFCYL